MWPRTCLCLLVLVPLLAGTAAAQVIEFESGGLKYQTRSKDGLTVMFAPLPLQMREYAVLQVAVSNGTASACMIRPEDFTFRGRERGLIHAASANSVVSGLLRRAGRPAFRIIINISASSRTLPSGHARTLRSRHGGRQATCSPD
jgi:hypothetical protein